MLKIAVCDDEKAVREEIINMIKRQINDVKILEFASGKEMLSSDHEFDITFLDIAMDDVSGIDVAKHICVWVSGGYGRCF